MLWFIGVPPLATSTFQQFRVMGDSACEGNATAADDAIIHPALYPVKMLCKVGKYQSEVSQLEEGSTTRRLPDVQLLDETAMFVS